MDTHFSHIQVNVNPAHLGFYKELMSFLGWDTIYADDNMLGVVHNGPSVWFTPAMKDAANDYDGVGMNHLSIGAGAQADVDTAAEYLQGKGVALLFGTPQHRPEFARSEAHTYYQIMFESPDRILFEIVYEGLKAA
jgi:catechol 2,3-dioxygenase-like lactoylglutathione lyase family enzyme